MTMSSAAGPMLVLLGIALACVTNGLDDAHVGSIPWPEPDRLQPGDSADLAELAAIADLEGGAPGAGRGRALALAERLLRGAMAAGSPISIERGTVPRWGDDTVLEFGEGYGHGSCEVAITRFEAGPGTGRAIRLIASLPHPVRRAPGIASREFPVSLPERRSLLRVVEALSSFRVAEGKEPAYGSSTGEVWDSAAALGPGAVLFHESFSETQRSSGDDRHRARAEPAIRLAGLLLRSKAPSLHQVSGRDRPWLRAAYQRGGGAWTGGLGECWALVFTVAGDSLGRRSALYGSGR